jgi:hypothetical protein
VLNDNPDRLTSPVEDMPCEITIILIMGAVAFAARTLLGHSTQYILGTYIVAAIFGFILQLSIGRELNSYNDTFSLYIGYVSVGIILVWSVSLGGWFFLSQLVIRRFGLFPELVFNILIGLMMMVVYEILGYNLFQIRLVKPYPSLLPQFNCMHAPLELYMYYILTGLLFYITMLELPKYEILK